MEWIPRLLAITSTALALLAFRGAEETTPSLPTPTPVTTLLEAPIASQTTTTTVPVPSDALCPQWWPLAIDAGWTPDLLPTLDYVMWRESRCLPDQHNTTLNKDGSSDMGLTQVNDRSWCFGTRWYPNGYLQTVGVLNYVGCNELFDPYTNLKAAKAIYDYSLRENDAGWQPWSIKG